MAEPCKFKDLKKGDLFYKETNEFSADLKIKQNDFIPANEDLSNLIVFRVSNIFINDGKTSEEGKIVTNYKLDKKEPQKRGRPKRI